MSRIFLRSNQGLLRLAKNKVVNRNVYKFNEETNETHDEETNEGGEADLLELCTVLAFNFVKGCADLPLASG